MGSSLSSLFTGAASSGLRRRVLHYSAAALLCALPLATLAHGFGKGDLRIKHPYATPSEPGDATGQVYLLSIENKGRKADRLLGASTAAAAKVVLNRIKPDASGVMQATPVPAIEIPGGAKVLLRHTGDYQLELIDMKAPLKSGDHFDLALNFENAGSIPVEVHVQIPKQENRSHDHDKK